jgi:hypothetical protein
MTRPEIGHAIPRPVLDEILQLLGYDPAAVDGVTIERNRVYVLTHTEDERTEYWHPVTPA